LAVGAFGSAVQADAQPRGRYLTDTPEGAAILRIEEQRAPTPTDLGILIESARSKDGFVQDAAIRALGRLERRDVVSDLLQYLRATRPEARREAATALGQAMRGEPLQLDPNDTQLDGVQQAQLSVAAAEVSAGAAREMLRTLLEGVQQALLSVAAAEESAGAAGEMLRTLARLPYRDAAHVAKADRLIRQVLELSPGIDRALAMAARRAACVAAESLARVQSKLFPIPEETLSTLRAIATAQSPTVKRTDLALRAAAMQALVTAGGVDAETLRLTVDDALSATIRRLSVLALGGGAAPVTGSDRLDYLRKGLADRDYSVRYEALRGYVRHLSKTDGCQPVMEMLRDRSEHVALSALDALGNCEADENVVNVLMAEARTPPPVGSWRRESHALVSLAKRAPTRLEIPLLSHSRHPVWQVRMYAARAAAAANEVPTLEVLALDPNDNVRDATLGALRRLKGDRAEPHFVAALERGDLQLLRTAAREMAGLSVTPALTAGLLGALARVSAARMDTSRDTRLAILERLREFGSERHREAVTPLLRDIDAVVASAAARTLSAWTGETYSIDPQPLLPQELPSVSELAIVTEKVAYMKMESGVEIGIRLDPVRAPLMSTRFLRLVNRNYYDGLTFHRVVSNFVVQGGSPGANEYAGDGPYVKDEISERSHERGTVGLSTRGRDTGDAQLFINLVDNPRLDFEYTVFGELTGGDIARIDAIQEGDRILNITFKAPIHR
jgi:cyclophilin family peptidyl-prolyl cis-trans isomerase/HEAT repeat protein